MAKRPIIVFFVIVAVIVSFSFISGVSAAFDDAASLFLGIILPVVLLGAVALYVLGRRVG